MRLKVRGPRVTSPSRPLERLTAADLMQIWPEDEGWPQDIGALAVLDGGGLLDAEGRFLLEALRGHIEGRLHLVPRFRQVLHWPGLGRGWPLWVDAQAFDIAHHVRVHPVPPPGDETQLLLACERLRRRRLDPARPLWEMWFLPGLPDGRVGFFMKLHHAVADGVAGIAALGAFVDPIPEPLAVDAPPSWIPAPMPSGREIFGDNVRRRLRELDRTVSALARPVESLRRIRRGWPAVRELFAEGRAPRTSVNRRIGSDRRLGIVRTSLETVKAIGHAHGGTVNDVLLTALAGGYGHLLRSRGEFVGSLVLRAFVPVSLHREQPGNAGNLDGGMVAPLPVGETDPMTRLLRIAAETAERKKKARPQGGTFFRSVFLQRAFLRLMPRQRFMNAYVANVPGPPIHLYIAGAPVLELFPVVPIMGNISIGVGALSYAGQFNITVVADRDVCPDLGIFMEGVRGSLDSLERSVGAQASAVGRSEVPGGVSQRGKGAHDVSDVRLHLHDAG